MAMSDAPIEYFADSAPFKLDDSDNVQVEMPDASSDNYGNEQIEQQSKRDVAITAVPVQGQMPRPAPQAPRQMAFPATNRSYPMLDGLGAAPPAGTAIPLVLAVGAALAGGMYAGLWGAASGLLLTGALSNAYRFATNSDGERTMHGVFTVIAGSAGGYAAYKAYKHKRGI